MQGWGLQCPGAVLLNPGAAPPPGLQLLPVELWERLCQHRAESKGEPGLGGLGTCPSQQRAGARDFPAVLGVAQPLPLARCLQLVLGWRGHSQGCRGTGSWRAPAPFVGFMAAVGRGSPVPLATPCVVGAARRSHYRGQAVVVAVTPSVLAPARPKGLCMQRSLSHGHSGMGTALGSCIPLSTRIPPGAGAPIAVPSWWRCPSNPSELPPGGNCSSSPELVFAPTPPCKPAPASPSPACLPFLTGRRRRRRRRRLRARSGRSKERAWEPGERGAAAQRDGTGQDGRAQLSLPPGTAWGGQQQPRAGGFAPCTLIQHRPHVSVCSASSASHGGTQELSPAAGSCLRAGCWGCCGHLGDPAAVPRGAVAMRRARGRGAAVPRAGQRGHNCPVGPRGWGHQGMGAGRGRWHPEKPQRGLAMPVMPPEMSR